MNSELGVSSYNETSASSEEETSDVDSSDESGSGSDFEFQLTTKKRLSEAGASSEYSAGPVNIAQKLFNREMTGCMLSVPRPLHSSHSQRIFNKVPNRLGFCLKDIVPPCFLQGHMFMGLSACGQFLLSYKVSLNDNAAENHYSFNITYKYTLYFWVYQPHKPLRSFYKCCLFDDHGVDNLKDVTMTQWKCADSRVLIVHGAAEDENEDSYITYVKVPRLGCMDCKKLRDITDDDSVYSWYALCLKCNLTIHTKYSTMESDRKFNPYVNLICPERIVIMANGFIHMLHIDVELSAVSQMSGLPQTSSSPCLYPKATPPHDSVVDRRAIQVTEDACDNHNNIVARIIADFSDFENDSTNSSGYRYNEPQQSATSTDCNGNGATGSATPRKTYDELIFTCDGSSTGAVASSGSVIGSPASSTRNNANSKGGGSTKVGLITHRGRRHHRIVTKSFRNGVPTVDLQNPTQSNAAPIDKLNTYEFSEDNEKCEKIATLRKRRLADKKYEFSEDNSENIIPFTTVRLASKSYTPSLFGSATRSLHRSTASGNHFLNSPCASPSTSPHPSHASSPVGDARHCTPPPVHRSSPISLQQDFRSPPCNSPVSVGAIRSPSRHVSNTQIYGAKSPPPLSQATQQMLNYKPFGALSPLQVSMTKRHHYELSGSMSPNSNVPFLSPRREDLKLVEVPIQGSSVLEKPLCTKKFKRRYVEEDDAASVITSEEDDCISPGYHTSLPMEVHGSCYSEMQMISQASYQHLRCASVVVTQHSFDLEAFTYYVISILCQKNQKVYDVFYDWSCELITVCPLSLTIICLLMAQFSARDQLPSTPTNCLNCLKKLDCAFHRCQFECRILFSWNMDTGEWVVLDYGELIEFKPNDLVNSSKKNGPSATNLSQKAKKLAMEMSVSLNRVQDYSKNLRVLDSNIKKSKSSITDLDNLIQFHLKRPRMTVE